MKKNCSRLVYILLHCYINKKITLKRALCGLSASVEKDFGKKNGTSQKEVEANWDWNRIIFKYRVGGKDEEK